MELLHALIFALAVSLDGFGVGLAYGIRKVQVPGLSLLIICLTSTLAITLSMLFGSLVAGIISPAFAEKIGSVIMVAVGTWILLQSLANLRREKNKLTGWEKATATENKPILNLKIPPLGIVVQILREPIRADFDCSGIISVKESLALGLALAMDALGAGFGAAVAGLKFLLVPLFVGIFKLIFVSSGLYLGQRWGLKAMGEKGAVLPGIILIVLGLMRI